MSKFYEVVTGMDYPPHKRAEPGDVIAESDLPKSSIKWLVEDGHIVPAKAPKPEKETSSTD